jgi:DNA primase
MEDRKAYYNQFTRNLSDSNIAQEYYATRNLSKRIVDDNLVGFCPSYSRYHFPLLRGRLIVPICDVDGKIIALAGRQIPKAAEMTVQSFWDSYSHEPAKCQDRINKWNKGKWINEPYH